MDIFAPIELNKLEYIDAERHGGIIFPTLVGMLKVDYQQRMTIDEALDRLTGLYE